MAQHLRIVPYITKNLWPARRGHPVLPAGTVVYTLELLGKYYAYCYLRKDDAEGVVVTLQHTGMTMQIYRSNFREDPEKTLHVAQLPGKRYPPPREAGPTKQSVTKRDLIRAEEYVKPESNGETNV